MGKRSRSVEGKPAGEDRAKAACRPLHVCFVGDCYNFDFYREENKWNGEPTGDPIATSKRGYGVFPFVQISMIDGGYGEKFFELPGSDEHAQSVSDKKWLPQVIVNDIRELGRPPCA